MKIPGSEGGAYTRFKPNIAEIESITTGNPRIWTLQPSCNCQTQNLNMEATMSLKPRFWTFNPSITLAITDSGSSKQCARSIPASRISNHTSVAVNWGLTSLFGDEKPRLWKLQALRHPFYGVHALRGVWSWPLVALFCL